MQYSFVQIILKQLTNQFSFIRLFTAFALTYLCQSFAPYPCAHFYLNVPITASYVLGLETCTTAHGPFFFYKLGSYDHRFPSTYFMYVLNIPSLGLSFPHSLSLYYQLQLFCLHDSHSLLTFLHLPAQLHPQPCHQRFISSFHMYSMLNTLIIKTRTFICKRTNGICLSGPR